MGKKKRAVTLIELIIVLAIVSTVLGSIYLFFLSNFRGLNSSEVNVNLHDQAQAILDTMGKDFMEARIIEDIRSNDNVDSRGQTSCNISTLIIKPLSGNNIVYTVNNEVLQREIEGSTTKEVAKYVESITIETIDNKILRDIDEDSDEVIANENRNSTKSVKITVKLKMKKGNKDYEYEASSNVTFRNADATD